MTVSKAREEIIRLQHFVNLVESYDADTLEKMVIKEYAYTNSITKVTNKLNVEKKYVTAVIMQKGTDDLHKLIQHSGYMLKTKSQRNRFK